MLDKKSNISSHYWSIYSDGSADPSGNVIGMGAVRRSPNGTISEFFDFEEGENLTSLEAEIGALRVAVQSAFRIKEPVVFYVDNKTVYQMFNRSDFSTPSRLKNNLNVLAIRAGLAVQHQFEIALTNDKNDSLMMLAHNEANKGRKTRKRSDSLQNEMLIPILIGTYRNACATALLGAAVLDLSDIQYKKIEKRISQWVDNNVKESLLQASACGLADPFDSEVSALYTTNYHRIGMYNFFRMRLEEKKAIKHFWKNSAF